MKGKSKLAAATVLAAAAAIFGACRADDTSGGAGASQAAKTTATNTASAKPSPSVVAQAPADDARRVKAEELKSMLDSGKAALYDTRAKAAYDAEHIKGALSMPSNEVADRAGELPRDKTLVFYCTWPAEHTSAGAVLTLKGKGITTDAAALLGGMGAWKEAKLPTEGTAVK